MISVWFENYNYMSFIESNYYNERSKKWWYV